MYGVEDSKRYPSLQAEFFERAAAPLTRREAIYSFLAACALGSAPSVAQYVTCRSIMLFLSLSACPFNDGFAASEEKADQFGSPALSDVMIADPFMQCSVGRAARKPAA